MAYDCKTWTITMKKIAAFFAFAKESENLTQPSSGKPTLPVYFPMHQQRHEKKVHAA